MVKNDRKLSLLVYNMQLHFFQQLKSYCLKFIKFLTARFQIS